MNADKPFLLGVIEGFYGRPWSHQTRLAYADYLPALGLDSYLYCPKSDPFLRRHWQERWPANTHREIEQLAQVYSSRGINLGLGLSPFALYERYDAEHRQALKLKIDYLCSLNTPTLAILFDDMPGTLSSLAARQAEIVADVCAWATNTRVLVCPTYYSFDPVLEQYFGAKPANYWRDLGAQLPVDVDIFWTGNRVCAESISRPDIDLICEQLGRKVILWDNYPVNDGAHRSNFIYSTELPHRDPAMQDVLCGHYCNPMNQAHLSLQPLAGLAKLYGRGGLQEPGWLHELIPDETYRQLLLDRDVFETQGLTGMGERRCRELAVIYAGLPGPAAAEVAGWLRAEYTFDPACLTD